MKTVSQNFEKMLPVNAGETVSFPIELPDGTKTMSIDVSGVDDHLGKQFKAYVDIELDLQDALDALKRKLELPMEKSALERKALLTDAIISYGRCFVEADERKVKLEGTLPWVEPHASKYHKEIMDLRNQHVAHSGASPYRRVYGYFIKNLPDDSNPFHGIARYKLDLSVVSNEDISALIHHVGSVQSAVKKKLKKIERKLKTVANQKGIEIPST